MRAKRYSYIFQVCFWFMMMALQLAMATNFLEFKLALLLSAVNMLIAMAKFYTNTLWLFPSFFEKKRYGLYVLINLGVLIFLSHVFVKVDGVIMLGNRLQEPPHGFPPIFQYVRMFSMLIFVYFISLVFSLMQKVQVQDTAEKQLAKEKSDTEIRLLKAQINPHFIFNSLNNIYSLTYSKSDQAPDAVLKLSEMLRYVYYDCNRDEVTLAAEIEYIRNYIAFQQMKSSHTQNIDLLTENINESFRIAPMLFIPFVENAFKYSKIEDEQGAWVRMKLTTGDKNLCFKVSNTHPENGQKAGSGMGIENVRNRLALTYPGAFELDIKDEEGVFEVQMKIKQS
jgi:two-component system LytT family sensor kinase